MLLQGVEVPVGVQQIVTVLDAVGSDQHVDRLANRDSTPPKSAIVIRGGQGYVSTNKIRARQIKKQATGPSVVAVAGEALQQLCKDQVPGEQTTRSEQLIEAVGLSGFDAVEVIDPNGGVHENHDCLSSVAPHAI
jgi:hypothetical protein